MIDDLPRVVPWQKLGHVATDYPDGTLNLSPYVTVAGWDRDHLVFADTASPRSVANLRRTPAVEVNVIATIARNSYRFKGWQAAD